MFWTFNRVFTVLMVLLCGSAAAAQLEHTLTGDVRLHQSFHSAILNNDRDVIVYLPPAYDADKQRRYPVFYMQDGQNLFDGATSFIPGQEWRADEAAQSLIAAGKIEPLIIVGVYNAGVERVNEYTAAQDSNYKAGGRADLYGHFMVEELKPFIDKTYRTKIDAKNTGLGGSSLGGLISLYLGLKYPTVFTRIAIVSPAVWWADNQIVHYIEDQTRKPPLRIWLDTGTKEGRDPKAAQTTVAGARLLKKTLIGKGWEEGKDFKYFEAEGAEHNEKAWAARFGQILEFLFPKGFESRLTRIPGERCGPLARWTVVNRSRAIENIGYALGANQGASLKRLSARHLGNRFLAERNNDLIDETKRQINAGKNDRN